MTELQSEPTGFLARWGALSVLCLTMFIIVLDTSMMNVAVPQISKDLQTDVPAVQAVIALYSLVMASLMLAGAKFGAIRGAKRVFRGALVVYGLGSLLAAVSWNIGSLALGWSVIEGVAAAALLPLCMSLIVVNYSGAQRALAFGVLGGLQATAAAIGPIFGGFLTTVLTWRLGFAFEVLIVLIALPLVRYLRQAAPARDQTLDVVGSVLSVLGLGSIVIGSLLAGRYGWWEARRPLRVGDLEIAPLGLSVTPWLIVIGLGLLVVLYHWQVRREHRNETPLFPSRLLANRVFVTGFSTDALQSVTLAGVLFVLPLFMQSTLGFDALGSGIVLLPLSVSVLAASLLTPQWGTRIPPKFLVMAGAGLMTAGILWLAAVAAVDMNGWTFFLPLLVFGAGTGLLLAQVPNLTLSAVGSRDSDEAAGLQNATKETGTSLGTAIIGSVLLSATITGFVSSSSAAVGEPVAPEAVEQVAIELEDTLDALSVEEQDSALAEIDAALGGQGEQLLAQASVDGFIDALAVVGIFTFLALLTASFLPRKRNARLGEQDDPDRIKRLAATPSRAL